MTYVALVYRTLRHLMAPVIAVIVILIGLFGLLVVSLALDERLCFDRKPPWGPPETGWDRSCGYDWPAP
jgi:hypothetical protein